MDREELTGKVALGQKPQGGEGGTHVNIWGTSIPSRRKSKCKGPEVVLRHEQEGTARSPSAISSPGGLKSPLIFLISELGI